MAQHVVRSTTETRHLLFHDLLRYRNFMEGRICKLFYDARQWDITWRRLRKQAAHWCNGFVLHLLQITHRQWTFRNQSVRYKGADGLTEEQQLRIMRECEALIWTDPSSLLPDDRPLLEVDFEALGDAPAIDRQLWLAEMEAARIASGSLPALPFDTDPSAPIDTEGSIKFRRRRKRNNGKLGNNQQFTLNFPSIRKRY